MAQLTVGFIGLGIMGEAMCRNVMKAGFPVIVTTRTKSKADALLSEGAQWRDTPRALAADCDVVITIVGYPKDVEEVYFGAEGVLAGARAGAVLVDMTTSSPALAERIAAAAAEKGAQAMDAPVSGGDVGAKAGTLSIMVGGLQAAFDTAKPVFAAMGETIKLMGPPGAGQHTKAANQIAIAGVMMGVAECLAYAEKAGLDPHAVIEIVGGGAARSFLLQGLGPKMVEGDFAPGFFVHHFVKDMGIGLDEAGRMDLDLPALDLARQLYSDVLERLGAEKDGTQALIKRYRE